MSYLSNFRVFHISIVFFLFFQALLVNLKVVFQIMTSLGFKTEPIFGKQLVYTLSTNSVIVTVDTP